MEATKAAASLTRAPPKAAWTSNSLKEFMGLSLKEKKLALNNEYPDMFFSIVSTLGTNSILT